VLISNGGKFISDQTSYYNLSFSNCGIASVTSLGSVLYSGPGSISSVTTNTGSGLLINSGSTGTVDFYISDIEISNISAAGAAKGGLIFISNTDGVVNVGSGVSVSGVNASETGTEGGIINIESATSIVINSCNFTNVKAKIGGVMHITWCVSVAINNCVFNSAESMNGDGGAIYFGLNTGFNISNSIFRNCKSTGGKGGAVATISVNNSRTFHYTNFSGNVGGAENKGNDFADIGNSSDTLALYSSSSISGVVSNSSGSKFYHHNTSTELDCLLNDNTCKIESIYVGEGGVDMLFCGISESLVCGGAEYALSNRLATNGTVYIKNGSHFIYHHTFSYTFPFWIVFEGYGFEVNAEESSYPTIYNGNSTSANWTYNTGNDVDQSVTYRKLRIKHTPGFTGWWFSPTKPSHWFLFEHCYFIQETGNTLTNSIFSNDYGRFILNNCTFHDIVCTNNPLYNMYAPSTTGTKAVMNGCTVFLFFFFFLFFFSFLFFFMLISLKT
jgi:hypothetical protein